MSKATQPTHDRASDLTQRKLFLHAETGHALLVSPKPYHHTAETDGAWIPRSQITEVSRETVPNPNFGNGGAAMILGNVVTFTAPEWLLKNCRLDRDAEVAE